MRPDRRRKKKLIVAFHFQFANRAAWKCDACRKSGLEVHRRCGWLPYSAEQSGQPVWVRKQAVATSCPVSYITAQSQTWIEEFTAWKTIRGVDPYSLPARTVEAFCLLEAELSEETKNGTR